MIDETLLHTLRESPSPELLARMNAETAHEWDRREVFGWPPRRWSYTVTYDTNIPPEESDETMDGEPVWGEDHGYVSGYNIEWSLYPDEHAPEFTGPDYDAYLATAREQSTTVIDVDPDDVLIEEDDGDTLEKACSREAVERMVEILKNAGATESCGSGESWYTVDDGVNFRTGESTRYAYHLEGFSRSELDAIANAIT